METFLYYSPRHYLSMFKSYYVVWKREKSWKDWAGSVRLNRTMQYGNGKSISGDDGRLESLNRTMQYGNKKSNQKKVKVFRV